jgi:predicted RNA binding protein YcfA (HicA-like mRNA interferase family)
VNPYRVTTKEELEKVLTEGGFVTTEEATTTGVFWKHTHSGRHLLVPHPYEEMYPEFILRELREQMKLFGVTLH